MKTSKAVSLMHNSFKRLGDAELMMIYLTGARICLLLRQYPGKLVGAGTKKGSRVRCSLSLLLLTNGSVPLTGLLFDNVYY